MNTKAMMRESGLFVVLSVFMTLPVVGQEVNSATFDGALSAHQWSLKTLNANLPADWSAYSYLVMDIKADTPQRFELWLYTAQGKRRLLIQPFGQNVWLRASIPLQYFKGRDGQGHDMAAANNRRTDAFWMSVWGPF
ncbi:MAG: CIA30 family protein, partial [Phycisphaerae bacterium]|nr:CIA30 family protein [Phycisphaerae bacterium]